MVDWRTQALKDRIYFSRDVLEVDMHLGIVNFEKP